MAIPRIFGPAVQGRISQLKQIALRAVADARGPVVDGADDWPHYADVIRLNPSAPADSAAGLSSTWSAVAGLTDIGAHIRYNGRWVSTKTGAEVELRDNQRVVTLLNIPEAGGIPANTLLVSDALRFADNTYGVSEWTISEVRNWTPEAMSAALCEWAREEDVG